MKRAFTCSYVCKLCASTLTGLEACPIIAVGAKITWNKM